jgi:hypothetical protein
MKLLSLRLTCPTGLTRLTCPTRLTKALTSAHQPITMSADKARRPRISQRCRGVSPRRSYASHTSPGFPACSTPGSPESRASKVVRRRVLSALSSRKEPAA